jgi:hypothetical protein
VFHHGVVHRSGIWGVSVRNEADGKSGVIVGQARCGSISRREPTSAPCLMGIDAALSAATSSRSVGNADPKLNVATGACCTPRLAVRRAVVRAIEMAHDEFSGRHRR